MSLPQSIKTQILEEYYSQPHYRGLQADLSRKYNIGQTTLSSWTKQKVEFIIGKLDNNLYLSGKAYLPDPGVNNGYSRDSTLAKEIKTHKEEIEASVKKCKVFRAKITKLDPELITIEKRVIIMAALILAIGLISLILFVFFSIFTR